MEAEARLHSKILPLNTRGLIIVVFELLDDSIRDVGGISTGKDRYTGAVCVRVNLGAVKKI